MSDMSRASIFHAVNRSVAPSMVRACETPTNAVIPAKAGIHDGTRVRGARAKPDGWRSTRVAAGGERLASLVRAAPESMSRNAPRFENRIMSATARHRALPAPRIDPHPRKS